MFENTLGTRRYNTKRSIFTLEYVCDNCRIILQRTGWSRGHIFDILSIADYTDFYKTKRRVF